MLPRGFRADLPSAPGLESAELPRLGVDRAHCMLRLTGGTQQQHASHICERSEMTEQSCLLISTMEIQDDAADQKIEGSVSQQ